MAKSKLMGRPPKNPKLLRNKLAKTYLTLETFDAIESYRQENFPDLSMSDFVLYCLKSEVDGPRRKEMLDTIFRLKYEINTTYTAITGKKPDTEVSIKTQKTERRLEEQTNDTMRKSNKKWEEYQKKKKDPNRFNVSPAVALLDELRLKFAERKDSD